MPVRAWGLVLSGGDGVRLQAFTRALTGSPIPKQYCRIASDRSLLEETLDRIEPLVGRERTLVVVTQHHLEIAADQLGSVPPSNLLVQPANRDTGPGLLFGLLAVARVEPTAIVAVFPSDHHVRHGSVFHDRVQRALRIVAERPGRIALLGVRPDSPDPDLGYVEPGAALGAPDPEAFHVAAFHEKPTAEAARRIIGRGGLWNTFIMAFRVDHLLRTIRRERPEDHERILRHGPTAYADLPPWNFSRDLLTRVPDELVVLRAAGMGWSDWGTPESIARALGTRTDERAQQGAA